MKESEKKYLERIEEIIEQFAAIQRDFVLDKSGIHAILEFIENFSGVVPEFSLNDPVLIKGKQSAEKVIDKLSIQLSDLEALSPPDIWKKFHQTLVLSIHRQLDGYREMVLVFTDKDFEHVARGRLEVDEAMKLLSVDSRGTPEPGT